MLLPEFIIIYVAMFNIWLKNWQKYGRACAVRFCDGNKMLKNIFYSTELCSKFIFRLYSTNGENWIVLS